MARPIIGAAKADRLEIETAQLGVPRSIESSADLRARLKVKRSAKYVELLSAALDAGTHAHDQVKVAELLQALANEFPELSLAELPSGIVAKCYLGKPYEVHTLDASLSIVTHYKRGEAMPPHLESARTLAQHPAYAFVEVYANMLRPVAYDGRVTAVSTSPSPEAL